MPMDDETLQIRKARRKFAAMACTYFLGVFNDNFYKQAALVLAVAGGRASFQGYALDSCLRPPRAGSRIAFQNGQSSSG